MEEEEGVEEEENVEEEEDMDEKGDMGEEQNVEKGENVMEEGVVEEVHHQGPNNRHTVLSYSSNLFTWPWLPAALLPSY